MQCCIQVLEAVMQQLSERLDWPKREDGIQLQITTNNYVCRFSLFLLENKVLSVQWWNLSLLVVASRPSLGDEESRIEPWEAFSKSGPVPLSSF